jgi:hypothetical protein
MTSRSMLGLSLAIAGSLALTAHGLSLQGERALRSSTGVTPPNPQPNDQPGTAADSLVGVFEGRTPCGRIATEFTGFPAQNCEKIKWRLTLYRDPATGNPTTYAFNGTRATRQGHWRIEHGAGAERNWVVYHLDYGRPPTVLSLLKVDDNVLLLLDGDLKVLVGDASWSYTLNRTDPSAR